MLAVAEAEGQKTAVKTAEAAPVDAPRLVVNISIDQLRGDLLEQFLPYCGGDGFKKLLLQGCVYENGGVAFAPVDRAAATASLSTGTVPYYNGIPSGEWVSRKTLAPVRCYTDQGSLLTPRGNAPAPVNVVVSTLGDEMKIASHSLSKVYSVAAECDAAIMMAGHAADGALWIDRNSGMWVSSAYYATTGDWINSFNKQHQPAKKLKQANYVFTGDRKYAEYATSPLVNADVTNMALQCMTFTQLGADNVPDMLCVQYYAGVQEGKTGTAADVQVKDTYMKLDIALGTLVRAIEQRVGKDNVLFVVSSTGYFDEEPIDYQQYKVPAGTVYINRTANLLNMYLSALYGQAHYVDTYHNNQIYLNHKIIEQKRLTLGQVLERSAEMLLMSDGVSDVYTSLMLAKATDADMRLVRNGFNTDVSGDLILEIAPGWKLLNETNQKQAKWKQTGFTFPVILYGRKVEAQKVETPVTIDQIAPTISKSIRIRAPNACKNASLH